jgi:uncharacterized protein YmfQ (DUF2313 family)
MSQTILTDGDFTPLPGWPCNVTLGGAPGIDDKLSAPSADDLLPQVLALTPRGAAWGTDEAGDGQGAGYFQRLFWKAIAAWQADSYARDFDVLRQAFPSMVSWSLEDREAEYALPDPCLTESQTDEQRLDALRAKFAFVGAASADFFICLAASIGFTVTVEEYDANRAGRMRAGYRCYGNRWGDVWKIHAPSLTIFYARAGLMRAGDRLATWANDPLECVMRAAAPVHTQVIFAYDL